MDSAVDWTHVRKELMNLKKCQQSLPKLKLKEEKKRKEKKKEQNIQELWDHSKDLTYKQLEYQKEKKQRTEGKF